MTNIRKWLADEAPKAKAKDAGNGGGWMLPTGVGVGALALGLAAGRYIIPKQKEEVAPSRK